MKIIKFILLVILVLFIYSCKTDNDPNPRQAIRDLVVKFPQLIEGKSDKDADFKLVRTVIDGEDNFKFQLYSQKEQLDNYHQIIVFINKRNKSFALPLFNNRHRDYWSFANDKLIPNVKKINSTFEKEFNYIFSEIERDKITHKDSLSDGKIISNLFISVLQGQYFEQWHGATVVELAKWKSLAFDIPVENENSVRVRFQKNNEQIKKDIIEINKYYFYFDLKGHRIFRFEYNFDKKKYEIRIYRQDYGEKKIQPIYL